MNTYAIVTRGDQYSEELKLNIQNKLQQFNIKTQLYTEHDRKYRLMCTSFNEMNKLISCLYYKDDLFCLQRKYEKIKICKN